MNSPFASATFSWLGISGGALTLFSHLEAIFKLANWAHWLATNWGKWVNGFWSWLLGWLSFDLTPGARFQVAMAIFIIFMVFGCRIGASVGKENRRDTPLGWANLAKPNVCIALALFLALSLFVFLTPSISLFDKMPSWGWTLYSIAVYAVYALCIVIGLMPWPTLCAISVAAAMIVISFVFQSVAAAIQAESPASNLQSLIIGTGFAILSGVIVFAMGPPRAFANKVWMLLFGLASILALSELSKLGLSLSL